MRHAVLALCTLAVAAGAQAQTATTLYKCKDGDHTVYSDKPCYQGVEVKRLSGVTGGPTPEDMARARERSRAEDRAKNKPVGTQAPKTASTNETKESKPQKAPEK